MRSPEPTTVGISAISHAFLTRLHGRGDFTQMIDGYRFAVGFGVARGEPVDVLDSRTFVNVGTLDPDQTLRNAVDVILGEHYPDDPIYKLIERLAEWGFQEMRSSEQNGEINYLDLLTETPK